jgi:uncharacterized protein (TIGR02421 family)
MEKTKLGGDADMTIDVSERERIVRVSDGLHQAAAPLRVLSHLAWPTETRREFLARGADHLPVVSYPPFDPAPTIELVDRARRELDGDRPVDAWLRRTADEIETTARMLAAAGTAELHEHAAALYGRPRDPLPRTSSKVTPEDLAERIHEVLAGLVELEMGLTPPPSHTAQEVAAELAAGLREVFGDAAPPVRIVDDLSANAAASARGIRVRRDALFTDRDGAQLLQHEAFIHVATALNGRRQPLRILAVGHPGTARAQEGLAVFAELASGTAELDRMRRLADRVLAIQLVIDGADFVDLFRWFRDRTPSDEQAYESARRAFRGTPLTGGAPFTKDVVYLYGLLEVAATVRTAFAAGRMDVVRLLFVGKLAVQALPALSQCAAAGLVVRPAFAPPWARDPRGLLALLTLSTFLTRVDLPEMVASVAGLLEQCPIVDFASSGAARVTT